MSVTRSLRSCVLGALLLAPLAVLPAQSVAPAPPASRPLNTLSEAEKKAGWKLLFDGKSLAGWRAYKTDNIAGWSASDGMLSKTKTTGDIVSTSEYGDFELAFEWKLAPGGNAGLFVRGTEEYDKIYWSATEYQLLDNGGHPDGKNPLTQAGSAYGLYPALPGIAHPGGEWNSSKIVVKGNHVEHWLNGTKMVDYEAHTPEWIAKVKASKFAPYPNYGMAAKGVIGIQGDHNGLLALRNIMIRPL